VLRKSLNAFAGLARRFRFGFRPDAAALAFGLALVLGQVLAMPAGAAERGVVVGSEIQGHGRIVFTFDKEIGAKTRQVNSVLIVEFDEAVSVDVDKVATQLGRYVTVSRADPDGKSLRFGLNDRYRVDLKLAGERVYLDILPQNWVGLPPALPAEVVQGLVRRARLAEDRLRKLAQENEKATRREVMIRVGTAPQFKRATFVMPRSAPATFEETDGEVKLIFDANFTIAPEAVRSQLAGLIDSSDVEQNDDSLRIHLRVREGLRVRGFREDDTYSIDFERKDGAAIESAAVEPPAEMKSADAGPAAPKSADPKAADAKPDVPKPPAMKQAEAKPAPAINAAAAPASASPVTARNAMDAPAVAKAAAENPAAGKPATARPALPNQILIQDLDQQRPIEARIEAGPDADGFGFRLAELGNAPVAVFQRGRALFVLIETDEALNLPAIPPAMTSNINELKLARVRGGTLLRVVPASEGRFWLKRDGKDLVILRGRSEGDTDAFSGVSVDVRRAFDAAGRESLEADVGKSGRLHMIDDPESGQRIAVVPTLQAGKASPKGMTFAEFTIEPTLAGFAVLPRDEAVTIKREPETLLIGHEIRLNLSSLPQEAPPLPLQHEKRALMLDLDGWTEDTRGATWKIERALLRAAAESPRVTRSAARARLARFYIANRFYPEALSVLDVLSLDDREAAATKQIVFLRAMAAAMMGRLVDAASLLTHSSLALEGEQKLLQAVVDAKAMRYPQANANFKLAQYELARYPEALQAEYRQLAIVAAIEAGDPTFARDQLQAFEQIDGRLRDPNVQQLLAARLAESQGQFNEAYHAYSMAMQSRDRRVEAEARYGRASSGLADGKVPVEDARSEFETLAAIWRRSEVEVKSLERLGEFYAKDGRWREAFLAAQRASQIMPDHPATRRLEEAMGRRFENLFLNNEADKLAKVEALAIYQEFRSLMPVGRRGDEIARRLADRLHDLDLVKEATEILEHQVTHRLDGVARASVATRLAVMYLQNRQPQQALIALRTTRLASLPEDLRRPRSLLEARALGDLMRTDLAIEILANDSGDDVDRLRADINWKGKRWREAGEGYERVLGDAWQNDGAMNETQRIDALRAGLAYVLGGESLSLNRLRGRYLAKMSRTDDAGAFRLVSDERITQPQAFREIARSVVNADTMTDFMASYRKRYPESGGSARPVRSAGEPGQAALGQTETTPPTQPLPERS
jgi:hypothetical protein